MVSPVNRPLAYDRFGGPLAQPSSRAPIGGSLHFNVTRRAPKSEDDKVQPQKDKIVSARTPPERKLGPELRPRHRRTVACFLPSPERRKKDELKVCFSNATPTLSPPSLTMTRLPPIARFV